MNTNIIRPIDVNQVLWQKKFTCTYTKSTLIFLKEQWY